MSADTLHIGDWLVPQGRWFCYQVERIDPEPDDGWTYTHMRRFDLAADGTPQKTGRGVGHDVLYVRQDSPGWWRSRWDDGSTGKPFMLRRQEESARQLSLF